MRTSVHRPWLLAVGVLGGVVLALAPAVAPRGRALGADKPAAAGRAVSYLREVRPILAQHCFGCHGPDAAARKGKLRLDLQDAAFAPRRGKHVIAPRDPAGSLVWQRITAAAADERMPPPGKADPLRARQVATIKAWIEQGAAWEDHWSFVPPVKPPLPAVSNKAWVRDPLDAFVLARLDKEGLKPEPEAGREAWLRRASFDLTGMPPTPAEIDEFQKDKRPGAYERQADRLLESRRYGERQAQEWLDLARYADTSGYQNDGPRSVWKWREWVVNAFNANMPFDQFALEQLAGDLLPHPTLAQRVATGFNRNHPTNSEAGEEEDEYRSAYVIDRVNTTATVFMGLTLACVQCHDHKYDPLTQRDYYSFYSFFNNVKERDADFLNPRPVIPVPNPDQEPRLADLKARTDALKRQLERDDPVADAAQKEWEARTLARLGRPVAWVTPPPAGMVSRNGSLLQLQGDGSVLSAGTAPVKDTYDVLFLPGKKHITALRLEVLPDERQPQRALGRATDGQFFLSAVEVRHVMLSEGQDSPLVYISRAEADINQKPKEDPAAYDMMPGAIESAIVTEPVGEGHAVGGGWSIADDERRKPHEAVFLPLEPLETNEASVLRVSLHHLARRKFKSLIGRFRISYTEDDRVRELLLPAQTKLWSSLGPFAAEDVSKAFATAFEPEKDVKSEPLDLKKYYTKVVPPPPSPAAKGPAGKPAAKEGAAKPDKPAEKKDGKEPAKPEATKADGKDSPDADKPKPKPEKITWAEQRTWRDGSGAPLQGANVAYYLTRKVVSTRPRTATVQIEGPAGFKMWLNGELVQASDPPPPAPPKDDDKKAGGDKDADAKKDAKGEDEDEGPPGFDPDTVELDDLTVRGRSKMGKHFRIGLRQGENEIVVKVVLAGGPGAAGPRGIPGVVMGGPPGGRSFTFNLTPEGDDVINLEVATALRLEAQQRDKAAAAADKHAPAAGSDGLTQARSASDGPSQSPSARDGTPATPAAPARQSEEKKVSLVGEKAGALKSYEEENKLTPSQRRRKVLRDYYRSHIDPVGRLIAEEIDRLRDEERQLKREMPKTLVMEELDKPRQAYIFKRGLYKNRGDKVGTATPAVLPPMPKDLPRNRLGLARWLVSGQHPLTARVLVNRVWKQNFGLGIVRTAEDFGIRGELPTHPELLDYLATELVDSKWDLKKLHKRIVLSATYRQASRMSPEKLQRDPENRLLSRGPRLRLTAEMIRDNALAVSGLLLEKIGGPSVKPRQPKNAWQAVEGFMSGYRRDRDEKQYRRGLYVYWKRGSPYPSMLNFDAVKRDSCTVTRAITTTPLQALTLLNDAVYVECARMLGQRMLKDPEALGRGRGLAKAEQDARRLAYGFRLCTSRPPTEREAAILQKLLDDQRAHFKADAGAAKKFLAVGDAKVDEALDAAEAAAWASVGNALLNLDATIHR
jgi:mono/diheme cytochrome c family protein